MNRYHQWVLLTLVLATLPSLIHLPLWVAGIAIAGVVFHYLGRRLKGWYGKGADIVLLCITAVAIWSSFESWFSGDAVLSFFIAVVFIKLRESRSRRDYLLLIFAAVILGALGSLYWENLLSLVHMLVVVLSLTLSLVAIHTDVTVLDKFFLIRRSGLLFLLGLPLMLLLFLTFPRIAAPPIDIGLAFGLPVKAMMDRGSGEFGKVKTLQPGGIHRAGKDNNNVLVAEFEGAVPYKSRLYWRGPVFWDYDGESWNLPENWDNRTRLLKGAIRSKGELDNELHRKENPVRYTLRVMPNGGRWLYGLDVPAAPAPEAFISEEFQLLSIRKIDDYEPKLEMLSYLDFRYGPSLSKDQRDRGLAWPENTNPRLYSLGQELAKQYKNTEEILHQAYSILADGEYRFDAGHIIPPGNDLLDRFFFDEKCGGAEYLAGSFVMLMRAAGIPAKLVSGFRGGTIIALTNFVIVKRSDAHAWVEIWQEGTGWERVEPKDIILPPEKKKGAETADRTSDSFTKMQVTNDNGVLPPNAGGKSKGKPMPEREKNWKFPSLSSLSGSLQKWVINYDPDRQMDILKGVGLEESNWLDLLIGGVAGVSSLLCAYLTAAWWRGRGGVRIDRVAKSWHKFCHRMEKKFGLKRAAQECPRDYLNRVSLERPELAGALEDIITRYINIRYGEDRSSESVILFRRQVERFTSMT